MGFVEKLCNDTANTFGVTPTVAAIILAAAVLLVVIIIVVIIVASVKKSKSKKVKASSGKSVKSADEKIKANTKAEEKSAVKTEEKPAELSVKAEEKVEETKEETKQSEDKADKSKELTEEKPEKVQKKDKKPAEKKEKTAKNTEETEKPKVSRQPKVHMGKWAVEKRGKSEFIALLFASNGELMLSSEIYSTEESARSGIETIIKGVDNGNFVLYQDKNKNYYYKLKTQYNRLLCVGEIYKAKDQCNRAIESVKRIAKDSPVDETLLEGKPYIEYVPVPLDMEELKKGQRGRWRMERTADKKYTAKLYANNGQLMLSTEEVASKKSAYNAVESVKKNAEEGNFVIDMDKFGRYYYKLRNVQKSVICIGEAYETLESCMSAIESVRKFALYSKDIEEETDKQKETK